MSIPLNCVRTLNPIHSNLKAKDSYLHIVIYRGQGFASVHAEPVPSSIQQEEQYSRDHSIEHVYVKGFEVLSGSLLTVYLVRDGPSWMIGTLYLEGRGKFYAIQNLGGRISSLLPINMDQVSRIYDDLSRTLEPFPLGTIVASL